MINRRAKLAFPASVCLSFSAAPAMSYPTDLPATQASERVTLATLRGNWSFSTDYYRSGLCQMSGNLHVFEQTKPDLAACVLTAVEVCGGERSVVEQSCEMSFIDGQVEIVSTIEQFIERKPSSLGYLPDNFLLDEVNADEMSGELESAVSSNAVFRRQEGGIS